MENKRVAITQELRKGELNGNAIAERYGVSRQYVSQLKKEMEGQRVDTFFTQQRCDRCGGSLKGGRIMSMYSEECLCIECKRKETERKDYAEAVEAESAECAKGNYNYKGKGYKKAEDE